MSKRIKKNLGTLTKMGRPGSFKKKEHPRGKDRRPRSLGRPFQQSYILAAKIYTEKRSAHQEEMVTNYLKKARRRFQDESEKKLKLTKVSSNNDVERDVLDASARSTSRIEVDVTSKCINPGCTGYGNSVTSYLCKLCYSKQKVKEMEHLKGGGPSSRMTSSSSPVGAGTPSDDELSPEEAATVQGKRSDGVYEGPHYGAGKSHFYAELEDSSATRAIPTAQPINKKNDSTLFLSNSTFYNDTSAQIFSSNPPGASSSSKVVGRYNISGNRNGGSKNGKASNGRAKKELHLSNSTTHNDNSSVTGNYSKVTSIMDFENNERNGTTFTPISVSNVRGGVPLDGDGMLPASPHAVTLRGQITCDAKPRTVQPALPATRGTNTDTSNTTYRSEDDKSYKADSEVEVCLREDCGFFGSKLYGGYCSKCAMLVSNGIGTSGSAAVALANYTVTAGTPRGK